ncbi:hypothetical protein V2K16_22730 [Pseudomonas alliivorans]|uniref:hypothetical protein n=1 Tax=Pseudomonas alliivorans TaxID=2810613 RepID=UPI001AE5DE79|nr:hypothetical protein [Pseudomonas alliivorans]MBP0943096.1 hypothetical protein [Pseudomonas alliivorans]MEE4881192.1 hypothetical protein [Pseudomonas alliivorans]MEE4932496.1 hypothetical protein [Pseudomonas alliivorans]MEE4937959.1 hypothetical protein [Pseudomonas alliivorans]MEE4943108.1 hypothetical protein [Pseudomonas alliivorans]
MRIFYSTPYREGDIGGALNEFCDLVPDDAWICIRDADTLFLTSQQQRQIQHIADSDPPFELIGCLTNRIKAPYQLHQGMFSEEPDITAHITVAQLCEAQEWGVVKPCTGPVAGMFMLFRKSLLQLARFRQHSIYFDKRFCRDVQAQGARLGVAQGIYLFHLYRFGKRDPCNYTEHLKSVSGSSPSVFDRSTPTSSKRPTPTR